MRGSMYKVMIIDDEEMVRWGIRDLLDWEAGGFTVCEDGRDGKEGLQKLLKNMPDLALVDIKMPGMNGIDLIREARKAGFEGHFIILTGYAEFEFARSAISLGVKNYLLKPIDEEELAGSVKTVRAELDKREGERHFHSANADIAREEVFRKILLQAADREALESQLAQHDISFGEESLCAAVLTDREFLKGKGEGEFAGRVEAFLRDDSLYAQKVMMENQTVLIGRSVDYREWAQKLSARNERIAKRNQNKLLIAVGHTVNRWYDLCFSYEFARFLLEQEFLFGQYDVLTIATIAEEQKRAENPSADQFQMLIEVGDLEGIEECVERFRVYCIKKLMKEMDIKIQILYNLMVIRSGIEKKYGQLGGRTAELMEKMNRVEELEQLTGLYCSILQDMCRQIGSDGSGTVIKRMYYYMEKNYGQDLKLENFAKMFN